MTIATRGSRGRFTGSIGAGRDRVPTPSATAAPGPLPAGTALGAGEEHQGLYELFKSGYLGGAGAANHAAARAEDRFAGHGVDAAVVPAETSDADVATALDLLDQGRAVMSAHGWEGAVAHVDAALARLGVHGVNATMRRADVSACWHGGTA